jgi:hypothetical protein
MALLWWETYFDSYLYMEKFKWNINVGFYCSYWFIPECLIIDLIGFTKKSHAYPVYIYPDQRPWVGHQRYQNWEYQNFFLFLSPAVSFGFLYEQSLPHQILQPKKSLSFVWFISHDEKKLCSGIDESKSQGIQEQIASTLFDQSYSSPSQCMPHLFIGYMITLLCIYPQPDLVCVSIEIPHSLANHRDKYGDIYSTKYAVRPLTGPFLWLHVYGISAIF